MFYNVSIGCFCFQLILPSKWGEGDPRWIVEERPDATNVNNWHWYEQETLFRSIILCTNQMFVGRKRMHHNGPKIK